MNKLESEYNEIEENDLWSERFQVVNFFLFFLSIFLMNEKYFS